MRPLLDLLAPLDRFALWMRADRWKRGGHMPGAPGQGAAKWLAILDGIEATPDGRYGHDDASLDERVVEYPWAFDRVAALRRESSRVLDAGSVLNHRRIFRCWRRASLPPVSIVTLAPEGHHERSENVSYEYADLRRLPYADASFDIVLCLSTLEHVGLDNRMYGAAAETASDPGAESLRVLAELRRVTQPDAALLLSVPFGARSGRGWFRIFDRQALEQVSSAPGWSVARSQVFRAGREGWRESTPQDAATAGYNDASSGGQRTAPAWVAAAEAVALVELKRA